MPKKLILSLALMALALTAPRMLEAQKYVVVVNPRNPVTRLTTVQVSYLFIGKLQTWNINGELKPALPVDQPPDSPIRTIFSQRVLRKSVSETEAYWRQELYAGRNVPPPQQSEADALETVRTNVGAIAYVSEKANLKGVKVIAVQ